MVVVTGGCDWWWSFPLFTDVGGWLLCMMVVAGGFETVVVVPTFH